MYSPSESYTKNLQVYADLTSQLRNIEESILKTRMEMLEAEQTLLKEELQAAGTRLLTANGEAKLVESHLAGNTQTGGRSELKSKG
jgi:hypothetical protein